MPINDLIHTGMYDTLPVLEGIMAGWHHEGVFETKNCVICGQWFKPHSGVHKFCSEKCKGKWQYTSGKMTSDYQYKTISGNWRRYFNRLRGRIGPELISTDQLLELLAKQDGKCALTGQVLTCQLIKGERVWTNASMDRIKPGGPYSLWNIQLVCIAVNSWRGHQPLDQFIHWCHLVARHREDAYGREQEPLLETRLQEGGAV